MTEAQLAEAHLSYVCGLASKVRHETLVEPAEPLGELPVDYVHRLLKASEEQEAKPFQRQNHQLARLLLQQKPDILAEIKQVTHRKRGLWERIRLSLGWD